MDSDQNSAGSDFEISTTSLPWQDMVLSVFRHRKMVFATIAIGLSIASVRAYTLPPTYKARAVLMVKDSRARVAVTPDASSLTVLHRVGDAQVNALASLLRDTSLVRDALQQLRAAQQPADKADGDSAGGSANRKRENAPVSLALERRAQALAQSVQVSPVYKTSLIKLSFTSGDPVWAAAFVNSLSQALINKYRRIYESSTAQEFFHSQRLVLADTLEEAQITRTAFRDRVGADMLTLTPVELRLRIAELGNLLDAAETERAELSAKAAAVVDFISNPVLAAVKRRIIELELDRSQLLSRYTKTSVAVRDLDRQITEAKLLLDKEQEATLSMQREGVQTAIDGIDARVATITAQISANRVTLRKLDLVTPEWERLESEVASAKEAYRTYSRKEEQARFSNALDESEIVNVAVVEPATPPTRAESTPVKRLLMMALGGSLLLGIGGALLRDWINPTVLTTSQVERMTGLPVLGEIQT